MLAASPRPASYTYLDERGVVIIGLMGLGNRQYRNAVLPMVMVRDEERIDVSCVGGHVAPLVRQNRPYIHVLKAFDHLEWFVRFLDMGLFIPCGEKLSQPSWDDDWQCTTYDGWPVWGTYYFDERALAVLKMMIPDDA